MVMLVFVLAALLATTSNAVETPFTVTNVLPTALNLQVELPSNLDPVKNPWTGVLDDIATIDGQGITATLVELRTYDLVVSAFAIPSPLPDNAQPLDFDTFVTIGQVSITNAIRASTQQVYDESIYLVHGDTKVLSDNLAVEQILPDLDNTLVYNASLVDLTNATSGEVFSTGFGVALRFRRIDPVVGTPAVVVDHMYVGLDYKVITLVTEVDPPEAGPGGTITLRGGAFDFKDSGVMCVIDGELVEPASVSLTEVQCVVPEKGDEAGPVTAGVSVDGGETVTGVQLNYNPGLGPDGKPKSEGLTPTQLYVAGGVAAVIVLAAVAFIFFRCNVGSRGIGKAPKEPKLPKAKESKYDKVSSPRKSEPEVDSYGEWKMNKNKPSPPTFGEEKARGFQDVAVNMGAYGGSPVPPVVSMCIDYLRDRGMQTFGLFNINAKSSKVKKLQQDVAKGKVTDFDATNPDIKEVAGLLVQYLREHCSPLFDQDVIMAIDEVRSPEAYRNAMYGSSRYQLAKELFIFLHEVSRYSQSTKQTPENLAVVFGPAVLPNMGVARSTAALKNIIQNAPEIFT